ncbi:hypothetical protein AKO1_012747 [Acrasis kona]|uniref:Uncharacterized protein n=1 Tax=Acrasis kona TaxID=1008807 RepID=A0AAW2YV58_9EUKA
MSRRHTRSHQRKSDTGEQLYKEIWQDPQAEITLFESMEPYLPLGWHVPFSVINIHGLMRKRYGKTIQPGEILRHIKTYYNLDGDAKLCWSEKPEEFTLPEYIIKQTPPTVTAVDDNNNKPDSPANKKRKIDNSNEN